VTCETQPTTGGTYTLACQDETGASNLLNAATFDLDATITADTYLATTLTATAADLNLAANSVISLTVASNNADLTGAGLVCHVRYNIR
jgi:hypothetical protein